MSDGRPRRRSFSLDLLRSVALLRVVTFHFSGREWLTAVPALALMFWAAGVLAPPGRARAGAWTFLGRRTVRVLVPLAAYAAAAFGVGIAVAGWAEVGISTVVGTLLPVTSLKPVGVTADGRGGWFEGIDNLWLHLWYIGVHLGCMGLAAFLLPGARRGRDAVVLVTVAATAVAVGTDLAVHRGGSDDLHRVASVLIYMACFAVGWLGRSTATAGTHTQGRGQLFAVAAAISATAVALQFDDDAPSTALALAGGVWIAAFTVVRPSIERWKPPGWVPAAVTWTSNRLVTIYVWHMMALYLAIQAMRIAGVDRRADGATLLQMACAGVITALLVLVFTPVERRARRMAATRSPVVAHTAEQA